MTLINYIAVAANTIALLVVTQAPACSGRASRRSMERPRLANQASVRKPTRTLLAAVCPQPGACSIAEEMSAGRDGDERLLIVTRMAGPPVDPEREQCLSWQFWLAVYEPLDDRSRELVAHQLLYEADERYREPLPDCPGSAADKGTRSAESAVADFVPTGDLDDDCHISVEVSANRLEVSEGCHHGRLSGSSRAKSVRLSPLAWAHSRDDMTSSDGDYSQTSEFWDWQALWGYKSEEVEEDGGYDVMLDEDAEHGDVESSHTLRIARLALPATWMERGWRERGVGTCAVKFDKSMDRLSAESDAEIEDADVDADVDADLHANLRLVAASDGTLFVEIHGGDLTRTSNAADRSGVGPVDVDQLEIWRAPESELKAYGQRRVAEPTARPPFGYWTIRAHDGSVARSEPSLGTLDVSHQLGADGVVRLRIRGLEMDSEHTDIALVYRDVEPGADDRLISTGKLGYRSVEPRVAECRVENGRLQLVQHQRFESRRVMITL